MCQKIKIMKNDDFNPNDSIKTIEEALQQAKAEKTGASFYYLLWGLILVIHYLLRYVEIKLPETRSVLLETLIWGVFPVGGLLSYLKSKKDERAEKVLSLYEKVYLFAFIGFALAYGVMFFASAITEPALQVTLCSLLLGMTVFIVGGITRHTISVIGGILAIICAGISLNVSLDIKYLLAALSSLTSCVIPGLLMKKSNV